MIDRLPAPARYAKAVGVQPRTLELWESAGVVTRALDAATPMHGQLHYVNGKPTGRIELSLPPDVPYGFIAQAQYETERLLAERFTELDGRVERGFELVGFGQDADGVTAELRRPDGGSRRAAYLVSCDDAHSLVRKATAARLYAEAAHNAPTSPSATT